MLPRVYRLCLRKDFLPLSERGQMANSSLFGFIYFPRKNIEGDKPALLNFIISKKTAKRAVDRNLIKRRLRHAVFNFLPEFNRRVEKGVFLVKGKALTADFSSLQKTVAQMLLCLKT